MRGLVTRPIDFWAIWSNTLGILISFCGIDGSGKTTQVSHLTERLSNYGISVAKAKVRFCGWSVVLGLGKRLGAAYENFLSILPAAERESIVACDVAKYSDSVVRPLLDNHNVVVWDRGPLCYAVYAEAHGARSPWLWALYGSLPIPDLSLLLDLPSHVAALRIAARTAKTPQLDETEEFLSEVHRVYRKYIGTYPNILLIDADMPPEAVAEAVFCEVISLLRRSKSEVMSKIDFERLHTLDLR